jgi:hypothetical protein
VLPFVNLNGDKEQEYFSDGLTEELLNSLTEISELHVAARTSSFYFKGKDVDLDTVAHKLNVGAVFRRERPALSPHHSHHRAAGQRCYGVSPLVADVRSGSG